MLNTPKGLRLKKVRNWFKFCKYCELSNFNPTGKGKKKEFFSEEYQAICKYWVGMA